MSNMEKENVYAIIALKPSQSNMTFPCQNSVCHHTATFYSIACAFTFFSKESVN